jgi:hypothetical protein
MRRRGGGRGAGGGGGGGVWLQELRGGAGSLWAARRRIEEWRVKWWRCDHRRRAHVVAWMHVGKLLSAGGKGAVGAWCRHAFVIMLWRQTHLVWFVAWAGVESCGGSAKKELQQARNSLSVMVLGSATANCANRSCACGFVYRIRVESETAF